LYHISHGAFLPQLSNLLPATARYAKAYVTFRFSEVDFKTLSADTDTVYIMLPMKIII